MRRNSAVHVPPRNLVYLNYWKRKQLSGNAPEFPIRRHWWDTDDLSEAEELIYETIKNTRSVLDVGAGDLRLMRLIQQRGFSGIYHTQDIGGEYEYTYSDLAEVNRQYDAVICADVLEHLALEEGVGLLHQMLALVADRGVLAVQTANANFTRSPLAWDMSHRHAYNALDLWTYFTALGMQCAMYRVIFGHPPRGMKRRVGEWLRSKLAAELLLDHCQNILLIATKPAAALDV